MSEVRRYRINHPEAINVLLLKNGPHLDIVSASDYEALQSHADALATAISQYLEALLKPDHTALTTRHLYSALKDYQDFIGTEKQDK